MFKPPLLCTSPLRPLQAACEPLAERTEIADSPGHQRPSAPKGHDIDTGLHWRQAAWQRPSIVGADFGDGPLNDPARGADVLMLKTSPEIQASHSDVGNLYWGRPHGIQRCTAARLSTEGNA